MIHNKDMRILFYLSLILFFSVSITATSYGTYYNDSIDSKQTYSTLDNNNLNHYTKIGNTVYSPSGTSYRQDGNRIYGSDGSSYTQFGSTIQNNSNAQSYQINNNLIEPLY